MTSAMQQPVNLAPGPCRQTLEGLAQFDVMTPGGPVQPFDSTQGQMAVGQIGDRFGLDRHIHRDPLQLALTNGLCLDRDRNHLRQQPLQTVRSDPHVPAIARQAHVYIRREGAIDERSKDKRC